MMTDQNYQRKVEHFVVKISTKYVNRKNIFEPLSKILPNYWNDIFLSAVKKIMFKRVYVIPANKAEIEPQLIWVVKDPSRGTVKIAKAIIEYERLLTQLIYRKNGWGDPYHTTPTTAPKPQIAHFEYKNVSDSRSVYIVSFDYFKRNYAERLLPHVKNEKTNDMLLTEIYAVIKDAFGTGLAEGVKMSKKTFKSENADLLVDIYNNLELSISDLKNIIDKS